MRCKYDDLYFVPADLDEMEGFFWHWYPHEISWSELQKINARLYAKLQKLGKELVADGRLSEGDL